MIPRLPLDSASPRSGFARDSAPRSCPRGSTRLIRGNGQASLELTVALIGALLLTMASFVVFFWSTNRLVKRHKEYERTRIGAAAWDGTGRPPVWIDPVRIHPNRPNDPDPLRRLRFFDHD